MNDTISTGNVTTEDVFVWRRLEEPLRLFGTDLPSWGWWLLLGVVLGAAMVYVVLMYVKDARGIGWPWAALLGLLRTCVYAILGTVFMLPANQTFLETKSEAKVLVAFDVSGSLGTSDALPTGVANEKFTTRQDQVLDFLRDPQANFIAELEKKNPVTVYRFGSRLDEDYLQFAGGKTLTKQERENPVRTEEGTIVPPEATTFTEEYWRAFLNPGMKVEDGALADPDLRRLEKLADLNARLVKDGMMRGTNIGDSTLGVFNKELNHRIQGIVVFTDGRNNEGSPNAFRDLEARAKAARVPIFVVGVGEDRVKVKIDLVDLRAPAQIQPEDKFRIRGDVTGEGLAGEKLDVVLEVVHTKLSKVKTKGKDGKVVEEEKEEELPIVLIEAENPDNPKSIREKITLGSRLELKPAADVVLDKTTPPRAEIEWQLDAAALGAAAKLDLLTDPKYKGKKWEIGPTEDDSELRFAMKVPTDKREGLTKKLHVSTKVPTKVIKKPIRVLLLAAAANRDYQFVRTLLVREVEKKRIELAIHLQLPPGQTVYKEGVVQDVPPNRLLTHFPESFRKIKGDLYDLSSYDVIIGFDPDWKRLSAAQATMLKDWTEKGGGLVLVGGYINTVELIRPPEDGETANRFKPITDLLPVVLDDRRDFIDRKSDDPWPLDLGNASPEFEWLNLEDDPDLSKFKEDWDAFFFGTGKDRTTAAQRGFFSFYPVKSAKTGSVVVARYADPTAKLQDNTMQPYIVVNPEALPRVVWIGSAETWRLREYREAYHERFWTKMVRYAAAKSKGPVTKPIRLEAATVVSANRYMEVEAKIEGGDGQPLARTARPAITLKMPAGVPDTDIKQPIVMMPRPGTRDGWFSTRFLVKSPGVYEMTVTVPRQPGQESEASETAKFVVKEANPELDNTRPDYDRMYRMASEADEVLPRMGNEGDKNELKRRLRRPKLEKEKEGEATDSVDIRPDKMRLFFDLKNASLIPTCMMADVQKQVSRGKHRDWWDAGTSLGGRLPFEISYVLLLVVGLLSAEWLTRKLLRLA
jgi:hypothetical protein